MLVEQCVLRDRKLSVEARWCEGEMKRGCRGPPGGSGPSSPVLEEPG